MIALWAVLRLTVLEAWRARLPVLLAVGLAVLLVFIPNLDAVDGAARLKLAVSLILGVMGFVTVLVAILSLATTLRRDYDDKVTMLLFSKPLRPSTYLSGRIAGLLALLLAAVAIIAVVGSAALHLSSEDGVRVRDLVEGDSYARVDAFGEVEIVDQPQLLLTGSRGANSAVRWHFNGLPSDREFQVFVRGEVRGVYGFDPGATARVSFFAGDPQGGSWQRLGLHPDSPYGEAADLAPGVLRLRSRDRHRRDLDRDFLRLTVPATAIGDDGRVQIEMQLLDPLAVVRVHQSESCYLARDAGSLWLNMLKGGVALLSQAAVIAAFAALLAIISNVGVTLIGCLSVYLIGHATPIVEEVLGRSHRRVPVAIERLLDVLLTLLPDFSNQQMGARLAAGQGVTWTTVGGIWMAMLPYFLIALALAWWALRRREQ